MVRIIRRNTVRVVAGLAAPLILATRAALANDAWPNRAIRLLVPTAAGGPADLLARLVAARFGERLGQPAVVENRPGANGIIAAEAVMRAPADGHTLFIASSGAYVINQFIYRRIPYDPFRDFAPISLLVTLPLVLSVHPSVEARSLGEFVARARREGGMNYGSSGSGTPSHLSMELLRSMARLPPMQHVSYNGSAPLLTAMIGGQVPVTFDALLSSTPFLRDGKLRALAASTARRLPQLPDLPTVAESGVPGFEAATWVCLLAPAATPAPVVARLSEEAAAAVRTPEGNARLTGLGGIPEGSSPGELAAFARAEAEKWGRVARETGTIVG
jgi:tripartite-type tricarboxylate transporter receptor subunit TctC